MGVDPAPSSQGRSWRPEAAAKPWTGKLTCQLTSVPWRPGRSAERGKVGAAVRCVSHLDHKGSPLQQKQLQSDQVLSRKGVWGAPSGNQSRSRPGCALGSRQCPSVCLRSRGGVLTRVGSPGACPKQAFPPSPRCARRRSPSSSGPGREPDSPGSMSRSESMSQSGFLQVASFLKSP